jgi:PIN domain nuclease of toxin-antitoxin system
VVVRGRSGLAWTCPDRHRCPRNPGLRQHRKRLGNRDQGRARTSEDTREALRANGFSELPITLAHARRAGTLPHHHRDPFDRMLIAQALIEGLVQVTRDRHAAAYGIDLLQA